MQVASTIYNSKQACQNLDEFGFGFVKQILKMDMQYVTFV